ncbi:MAG: toxin-antitoxin system, antitoxin component [Bacteroidota bacterium]
MPQLSLYIDEETLKKISAAAKIENISLSKWASIKLADSLSNKWPENYFSLFGAITDDSFALLKEKSYDFDSQRESL